MILSPAGATRGRVGRIVLAGVLLAGCSASHHSKDVASTTSSTTSPSTKTGPGRSVDTSDTASNGQPSPVAAVRYLLQAEQRGDHAASFAVILHGPEQPYQTVAQWTRRRQELAQPTQFTVDAQGGTKAVAVVEHEPSLDPFRGLTPARERQVWHAHESRSGWLLDPEPDTTPILPPDAAAHDAALGWAVAVQRCDHDAAAALQAVTMLFGTSDGGLCNTQGAIEAGSAEPLPPGPLSADIVAQYTADALEWARVVRLVSPLPMTVVLAPIGDEWKVLGIGPAQ